MPNDRRPVTLDHLSKKAPLERVVPVVLGDDSAFALQAAEKELARVQGEFDTWMSERRDFQLKIIQGMSQLEKERFLSELPDPPGAEARREELSAAKEAVEAAKEAVREDTVHVRVRALGRKRYDKLLSKYPPTEEEVAEATAKGEDPPPYNIDTFGPALVSASAVEPEMPLEYVQGIWDEWNSSEITELWTACLIVNTFRRRDLGNV